MQTLVAFLCLLNVAVEQYGRQIAALTLIYRAVSRLYVFRLDASWNDRSRFKAGIDEEYACYDASQSTVSIDERVNANHFRMVFCGR